MSHLNFKPETGLEAPETARVRARIATDWENAFSGEGQPPLNSEAATPAGQLIDAQTAEVEAKNAELLFLANQFNPQVAEGRWQDALGHIYFLRRKLDEPTVVTCQVTGRAGTAVPYGALVRSREGQTLICNHAVRIGEDGRAETTFRCSETGPIPIAAGSVTGIVTTVPGWDTVDNEAPGALGRERESRSEFEARRAASVAANAHGSAGALYGAVANIPGVLDVQVLENIGPFPVIKYGVEVPGHGVTVCIYGGEDADIARAIYEKKDAGCDTGGNTAITHIAADYSGAVYNYRILRPTTVAFWVRVRLGRGTPLNAAITAMIKEAVLADFNGQNTHTRQARVGLAQDVYASRFAHAVTALEEVKNLYGVTIALGDAPGNDDYTDFVAIRGDQEPVLSLDTISIVQE